MVISGRKDRGIRVRKRFQVRYGEKEPSFTGFSGNVSREGIMIRCVRVFGAGTILSLEIEIGETTYRLRGKVRWAREGNVRLLSTGRIGMGIRLLEPSAAFLAALRAHAAGMQVGGDASSS